MKRGGGRDRTELQCTNKTGRDGFGPATGDDSSPSGQQKKNPVQELEEYAVTRVLFSVSC